MLTSIHWITSNTKISLATQKGRQNLPIRTTTYPVVMVDHAEENQGMNSNGVEVLHRHVFSLGQRVNALRRAIQFRRKR